ncbi:hypothetical protein DICPUDRAFT_158374 [Dictyostelium purpureum]|uniref:Uncharacterized protein n=1 Tax=Dictyostelium purpureum TaxID=5786 RepID=F1A1G7_DICPU|nr:uncharacterized protein DICPUDRAFT_158374 [Dictyostelium purpureum]EGC29969.1 hypothetical protein DICPUDRAFT_158374 [Dictyostelium purpureum]|eukprot:XP_003293508.1 hypothetical protein DICPUDRAFT_158374 [Dictyostelium purpureum]
MDNSSNNNNNYNNNNYDQKTSELFYLVFHNKYLFNKIFHFIHSVELIKYNSINDIPENRIIFKNIKSVNFLLNKKLYHLLKCKLESDEYIHVDHRYKITEMMSYDIDLAKEIFKLLLQSTSLRYDRLDDDDDDDYVEGVHYVDGVHYDDDDDNVESFQFNYFSNEESIKLENLKLVLQNNTNNWKKIKNYYSRVSFKTDIETIKFYFKNQNHLNFMESDIWETIGDMFHKYVCKIDKKKFCQLIESIPPCKYEIYSLWKEVVKRTKTTIPTEIITDSIKYNDSSCDNYKKNKKSPGITTTLLVVKDKQTVDLISDILSLYEQTKGFDPEFSMLDIMGSHYNDLPKIDENTFKFNNVELFKYIDKKIFKLFNLNIFKETPIRTKKAKETKLIDDTFLEIPLKNAMETFNLKELKSIFELTKDYSLSRLYYSYKKPNRPLSYQDITQLTEIIKHFININCPQGVYYCLDLMPEGDYEHTEKDNYLTNLFNSCEVLTTVFAIQSNYYQYTSSNY